MKETESDKRHTITLPDGSTISLQDWVYGSFRGAGVIMPYGDATGPLELFATGRSQQLPGGPPGENSTFAHSNILRSGDNGLPRDWEMIVHGWRAQCSLALEQEVIDFASTCAVRFEYNGKMYRDCTLAELLLGGSELTGMPGVGVFPVHMRENLQYKVSVIPQSGSAVEIFQRYLRSKAPTRADPTVVAELDQLARLAGGMVGGAVIGNEIKRIQAKLQPGVRATFWVNLDGFVKRVVV